MHQSHLLSQKVFFNFNYDTIHDRTMSKSNIPSQYPPSLSALTPPTTRRTYGSRERRENLIEILEMAINLLSETEDQTKSGASSNGHGSFQGHASFNGDDPCNGDDSFSSQR
jgi:hypothetical protein